MKSSVFAGGVETDLSRHPQSMKEALKLYFTIMFGVSVSMLAFYFMFPHAN